MVLFVFTLLCTMHVCCVFLIKYSVFSNIQYSPWITTESYSLTANGVSFFGSFFV